MLRLGGSLLYIATIGAWLASLCIVLCLETFVLFFANELDRPGRVVLS